MKKILRLLFVLIVFLPATAFAYEYQWTGADCQTTNNAGFDIPGNWFAPDPFAPPIPTPGASDTLIFDTAYKTGSCSNDPFDTISANFGNQWAEWGSIIVTGTFDGIVTFSNFGGLNPITAVNGEDVDLIVHNDFVLDTGVSNSYGVRFMSSTTTNKVWLGDAVLRGGKFDFNNNNPWIVYGNTLGIEDPFQFEFSGLIDGCKNSASGRDGGFIYDTEIQIFGENMIDCYYNAPLVTIDPGVTNNWLWNFGSHDNLHFENSLVEWVTQNTIASDFELKLTHSANTLDFSNSILTAQAGSADPTIKIQATHGTLQAVDSNLDIATLFLGGSLTSTFTNTNIIIEKLFFEDQHHTNTWLNSIIKMVNKVLGNSDGFGFNPNTNYNMNLNFSSPTGANIVEFYPADTTSDWDYPAYNITLENITIRNNQAGKTITDILTLEDTSGIGVVSDYYPEIIANEIIGDSGNPVSQPIYAVNMHAPTWTNIDKFSGYISGEANYSSVTYNALPSLSVSGTTNLLAGGTPHVVRNLISPPNGTILIAGNHTFEWTEEWGVDGYECQLDEVGDNFASLDLSWSNTGQSNTSKIVDLNPLSDETYYEWRCRTEKTDVNGVQQFSNWTDANQLFLLYHFQNTAHNNTMAFDILSAETLPAYDTPVNRSLGSKLNIDLDFAMFNVSTVDCDLSYNDDYFQVTDDINIIGSVTSSTTTLIVNEKEFDAPLDGRTYDVACLATNTASGNSLYGNFSFAIRSSAVGTGGGSGNVSVAVSDFNREAVSIGYTGLLFVVLGVLFFYVGSRTKKQQVIIEQDEDYT